MQAFVIVNVYVMLYSLYTTVLDVSKPLELIILVRRQLGSEDPYPMSRSHDVLQLATHEARKFLGKAMSERYKNVLEEIDFKFLYLIDAQSMLYPPMTSGKILVKLINATNIDRLDIPVGWTQESLQKQQFVFVNQFIWNKIRCLAETQMARSTPAGRLERPAKRVKTLELLSAVLDIVVDDDKKDANGSGECFETATQMVNAEIQILKGIGDETNIELWSESTELCKWWARQTSMPCLMQAALAILANKPSSGGLECNLGNLSNHLIPTNPTDVVLLDKKMNLSWENNIPKRPIMALYDAGEEDEKEEEDTHDDNDNLLSEE
ncbi:hypothetical protein CY35_04G001500, partial [Sphagnum magellanicum]